MLNITSNATKNHLAEWVEGSGISLEITEKCLDSVGDRQTIAQILGWEAYPDHNPLGWVCGGVNLTTFKASEFCQFKPDTPIQFPDSDKPAKYLSPKHTPYDAIALPVRDWADTVNDQTQPIAVTEGTKKGAALETCNHASLSLAGVEMGLRKGRLVPNLEAIAVQGRPITLIFDADSGEKPEIQQALVRLATALKRKKCQVFIVPAWDISLGKGIDDVLANHGPDKVQEIMDSAIPYSQWLKGLERQFKSDKDDTQKVPPADRIARTIAEEYRDRLAYNNESGMWMRYEADHPGVWATESPEFIESIVSAVIASKGIEGYGSFSYITNVVKHLRSQLIVRAWIEKSPADLVPFKNGVLELGTGKLLPHSPGYRFTWAMPREHSPDATNWPTIGAFLDQASQGNEGIKNILIAYCNAVLKGRSDIQKFLHLTGPGGSGKGTFTRLLIDLIGQTNTHSSTLEDWCGNRFESANAYKKRLVCFPDEDRKVGSLGRFKSLTGEDWLRAEEKGKKAFQFRYEGMVLVASNFPIFQGDSSSGLTRRTILVPFSYVPKNGDRRNLNKEFEAELSAFTNYLLSLSDGFVTDTLLGTGKIQAVERETWANRQRTDSIAAWLNDWVIYDPTASTPVGSDRHEGKDKTPITLYGSYCLHAQQSGTQSKSVKNFSPDLLELCNRILGWTIEKASTKTGKVIKGLRLRSPGFDDHIPTYEAQLDTPILTGDGLGDGLVTDKVTAETLDIQGGDGCDGLNQLLSEKQTNKSFAKVDQENDSVVTDSDPSPVISSTTPTQSASQPSPNPSFDPSPDPSPLEPDFDAFPHLTSGDRRAKEKLATKIKQEMLSFGTREELTHWKETAGHTRKQIRWVLDNALTPQERNGVLAVSAVSQPTLFPDTEASPGDRQ